MTRSRQPRRAGLPLARRLAIAASSGLAVLIAALVLAAAWGVWVYNSPGPAARHGPQTTIVLRHGAGLTEIVSALQQGGVIRSGSVFAAAAQISGAARHLKAGEYAIASRAPIGAILDQIRSGRIVRHFVTIPEGVTSQAVVDILMSHDELQGSAPVPAEGSVMPETYDVERGEDRAAVLKRTMDARDRLLADLWRKRKPGLPLANPQDAVTLASIVEKETALADERPRVAAVFVNRLRQGLKLESDPTIIYGLTGGKPLGHGLRQSEMAQPNPYSTYQIVGLPPGPIGNPGRASLAAVLDPPDTDELFFVATGNGGHVFASTYAEHARNVDKLRQVEQGRAAAPPAAAKAATAAPTRR